MTKTIIDNFYNEEYLFPQWLTHHKKIFDHGILLDFQSTDRSKDIIKKICPRWEIKDSVDGMLNLLALEWENNEIQKSISGWRLILTNTEFLVGDIDRLFSSDKENQQIKIPMVVFSDWNPTGWIDTAAPLWDQLTLGCVGQFGSRLLHNSYVEHSPGRHYDLHGAIDYAFIFKYSHCMSSPEMLKRRLQIQHKFHMEDILKNPNIAWHHHNRGQGIDISILKQYYDDQLAPTATDQSQIINFINQFHK